MTATPRTQRILDTATKYGWEVEDRGCDVWAVHPPNTDALHPDGFSVYNSGKSGARVVSQATWKPVAQRDVLNRIACSAEVHDDPTPEDVGKRLEDLLGGETKVFEVTDTSDLTAIIGQIKSFVENRIDEMPEEDKDGLKDYAEGALLASAVCAELVDECAKAGERALEQAKAETPGLPAAITSRGGAQAWLSLSNATHDPAVHRRVFRDFPEAPNDRQMHGAAKVFESCKRVWEAIADSIYMLDPTGNEAVPVSEFLHDMHEHAQNIRDTADESFGKWMAASDADFEGLLA